MAQRDTSEENLTIHWLHDIVEKSEQYQALALEGQTKIEVHLLAVHDKWNWYHFVLISRFLGAVQILDAGKFPQAT